MNTLDTFGHTLHPIVAIEQRRATSLVTVELLMRSIATKVEGQWERDDAKRLFRREEPHTMVKNEVGVTALGYITTTC